MSKSPPRGIFHPSFREEVTSVEISQTDLMAIGRLILALGPVIDRLTYGYPAPGYDRDPDLLPSWTHVADRLTTWGAAMNVTHPPATPAEMKKLGKRIQRMVRAQLKAGRPTRRGKTRAE